MSFVCLNIHHYAVHTVISLAGTITSFFLYFYRIVDIIITVAPAGLLKSNLTALLTTCIPQQLFVDVTWTPTSSQSGPNILCYYAENSIGWGWLCLECVLHSTPIDHSDQWVYYVLGVLCASAVIWWLNILFSFWMQFIITSNLHHTFCR